MPIGTILFYWGDTISTQKLDELLAHPTTATVFVYLKSRHEAVGVREIQKALKLSNPSSAYWYLNKLKEQDVMLQLDNSSYKIHENYANISKINIPVPMQYFIVGNSIMPNVIAILVLLVINFILMIITFLFKLVTLTAII